MIDQYFEVRLLHLMEMKQTYMLLRNTECAIQAIPNIKVTPV